MVTVEQAQRGLAKFVDAEILPGLSLSERVIVGGGAGVIASKLPRILERYADHRMVSELELYDRERQELDLDVVYNAVKPYVGPDPIPVKIPMTGLTVKLTQREIDALYKYIKEA